VLTVEDAEGAVGESEWDEVLRNPRINRALLLLLLLGFHDCLRIDLIFVFSFVGWFA
jgi:hypothetical protein